MAPAPVAPPPARNLPIVTRPWRFRLEHPGTRARLGEGAQRRAARAAAGMVPVPGLGRALRGWGKSLSPRAWGQWLRQHAWLEEESQAREAARSTAGFMLGMALAGLYGALVLLAQSHNVWYCLVTTVSLGAALGLGMAFSVKVRVTVLLALPHAFTREGKTLLLLLALGMATQGPCTNILHNFSRAAESISCGAELALNQTAERLQRAREPLLNVLAKIKDIAQKAKVVGDRVRKFFHSIMDSVSHVARALRNVWIWLASVGTLCNRELGTPYRRCLDIFSKAKDNCERAIPFLYFLCYVVVAFKPLCGLANIILLFCVIPQYVQSFLRRQIAVPLSSALDRVRREFEFNISAVHRFDVSLNSSKTLGEVALDIMEGVRACLEPTRQVLGLFAHFSSCVILYMYLQALRYRHRYLRDDTFDNVYITRRFVELDVRRAAQGKPTVLPLRAQESGRYVRPDGLWFSRQERRRYGLELAAVLRHVVLGLGLILADYSVFWLLDLVRHQLRGEVVARAPAGLGVSVNGTGYASEIFRDLVSAFDALQQGNISVLSQRCRLQPVEPDYRTYLTMGILYGVCLFIAAFGSYVGRLRRAVCAAYYPCREQERTCFLYNSILARRTGLVRALHRAARRRAADGGHPTPLLILAARLPGCARLARLLGARQRCCLACGTAGERACVACSTPGCRGLYCRECYRELGEACSVCMAPLSQRDAGDEERDSSDEEAAGLWLGALRALRRQPGAPRREQGRLLRRCLRRLLRGGGGGRRLPPTLAARLQAGLQEEASGDSDGGSGQSCGDASEDSSGSSLDFGYQEQPEGSASELEEVTVERPPSEGAGRPAGTLPEPEPEPARRRLGGGGE
ncbi:DC-STAMP domain-containing protein 2 [Dromaius novaehollandiae]|uniref:DC-STAMP domain-containing protein 2 n=1 Tax=Dromaius novaehollandiae TaxID=8790 RepID=UPI00311EA888